jgi:hypothetical protein
VTSIWFSSPAFQRYGLSRIVFEQRAAAIEKLKVAGYEANAVIVADDENLDIAKEFGFLAVERDNEWLGQRFNDGYQHAVAHGADYVFPIGSDSWCDPQFIIDALRKHEVAWEMLLAGDKSRHQDVLQENDAICSRHYTRIDPSGMIRRQLWVPILQGVSYAIPATALAMVGNRPCQDQIRRGCDGSTWQNLDRACKIRAVWSESHPLETTAFESWPQITSFDKLGGRWARGDTHDDIWADLRPLYGDELVDKVIDFYVERREAAAGVERSASEVDAKVKEITRQVLSARIPTTTRQKSRPLIEQAVRIALEQR